MINNNTKSNKKSVSKTIRLTKAQADYLNIIGNNSATNAIQKLIEYHQCGISNNINYEEIHDYILETEATILTELQDFRETLQENITIKKNKRS